MNWDESCVDRDDILHHLPLLVQNTLMGGQTFLQSLKNRWKHRRRLNKPRMTGTRSPSRIAKVMMTVDKQSIKCVISLQSRWSHRLKDGKRVTGSYFSIKYNPYNIGAGYCPKNLDLNHFKLAFKNCQLKNIKIIRDEQWYAENKVVSQGPAEHCMLVNCSDKITLELNGASDFN